MGFNVLFIVARIAHDDIRQYLPQKIRYVSVSFFFHVAGVIFFRLYTDPHYVSIYDNIHKCCIYAKPSSIGVYHAAVSILTYIVKMLLMLAFSYLSYEPSLGFVGHASMTCIFSNIYVAWCTIPLKNMSTIIFFLWNHFFKSTCIVLDVVCAETSTLLYIYSDTTEYIFLYTLMLTLI